MSRPSATGIILSGIILAGLPFIAIAQHWHVQAKDARFVLLSELILQSYTQNANIQTEINQLNLSELTGPDNIRVRDTVYIHMARGPEKIAYPFGISKTKGKMKRDEHAFSLKGTVMARNEKVIDISYNFESFLPTREMKTALKNKANGPVQIELAVNDLSIARLVAVEIAGESYPYRVIEKPVLKGLTK